MDSLEELQIAAKITEEEGDTPMLSYIRRLIDQVAGALAARRPPREPRERLQRCNAGARSSEETKPMTTVLSQREAATTERPDSKGDAGDKMPDYRQCTAGGPDLEVTPRGDSTLAVVEIEKKKKTSKKKKRRGRRRRRKKRVSSASSSSSSLLSASSAVPVQEDSSCSAGVTVQLKRENSSDASLRSGNTTATYVVQEGFLSGNLEQVASDNEQEEEQVQEGEEEEEEEEGEVEVKVEEEGERGTGREPRFSELLEYEEDGIPGEERGDMLNALRVIEELGKKDEAELLQMLRDMLLPTEEEGDLGDSGDGFRSSRSGQDRQRNEVATSRSARTVSLPSSPRKPIPTPISLAAPRFSN